MEQIKRENLEIVRTEAADRDDALATNLRFSWLRKANTGLYLVFNDIQGYDAYPGAQPDRSLIAKYTYLFDL